MPTPTPFPPSHTPPYPALYLYPLNDSFIPKHISLLNGQRVKIGRQTNAKTAPGERNGYFDSKVLSRQHAEVWEEGGKIFIKDVKSSNGTFINGERLSQEGLESDPYELKTDDIVEFGIDIVGEDNKTIIHHKVAARVTCIFNSEDALAATRDAYNYQQQGHQSAPGPGGTLNAAGQRRPALQSQPNGIAGMGGLGGAMRQPGKSGLTFEHILSRLQGELQKSRETSADLNAVSSQMGEIGEVIGGGQLPNPPSYPHQLPAVRPPTQTQNAPQQQQQPENDTSSAALQALQNQLAETQASLSSHVEKFRTLETLLNEHDGMRREVNALRELIQERERQRMISEHMHEDDESDTRSIHTIVPHELESVPEEDESDLEETVEERHARREELGRPRTPEPSSLGMVDDDDEREHGHMLRPNSPPGLSDEMTRRLSVLSEQLESALELSRNLQAQHAAAQQTIESLESKVSALEELVRSTQAANAAEDARLAEEAVRREKEQQNNMSALFDEFKRSLEQRWDNYRLEWDTERERMDRARTDWERRIKSLEDGMSNASGKFELSLSTLTSKLASLQSNGRYDFKLKDANGRHTKGGLVTPPSPRSLSTDSDSDSQKRSRRRSSSRSRRGRSKTKSRSPVSTSATLVDSSSAGGSTGAGMDSSIASLHSRLLPASPLAPVSTDSESAEASPNGSVFPRTQFPLTPESSLVHLKAQDTPAAKAQAAQSQAVAVSNAQVAVGVFVLGVAAAAVLWRVKDGK